MKKKLIHLFAMTMLVAVFGCGGSAGSIGDEKDPGATTDDEQMGDETGEAGIEETAE